MNNSEKASIEFERETKYKIGAVTYVVTAHFDENGENLKDKMKHLLTSETVQDNLQKSMGAAKDV